MTTSKRLSNLALLALLGAVAVYVVAVGTRWGLRIDREALPRHALGARGNHLHVASRAALESLTAVTMALAGAAAVFFALRRGRRDLALAVLAILLGANLTTTILKPLLAATDPFGGESLRAKHVAYPSGHATAVMSLATVAILVARRHWRLRVAVVASTYVAVVGVALVVAVWHQPSDVVGGYFVSIAWAAGVGSVLASAREGATKPELGRRLRELVVWIGGAAAAAAIGLAVLAPATRLPHGMFAVGAVIIVGLALVLPVALAALLSGRAHDPEPYR